MTKPCVVFSTPGLIPLESFTTFGVNAKPNSTNPFGYFGTGLKYAISVLLREEQEVVLYRGRDKYTFYLKREDFRDKQFSFVRMKLERWSILGFFGSPQYTKLPFTTELGKNWKLWQAFRELETNTRDEGGETYLNEPEWERDHLDASRLDYGRLQADSMNIDSTQICVYGNRFIDEYHDRHRNFLPEGKVVREDAALQVIDKPSKHVYYRSVRIMDLSEEAEFTYNFLSHVDHTEDRTAMYPSYLEMKIAEHISQSEDEEFLSRAVGTRRYERNFNYGYASTPSTPFIQVARESPNPTAREIAEKWMQPITPTTRIIITVPRSEVSDDEMERIRLEVMEILGVEVELKDMREAA
jgi:hypothetical protein